MTTPFRKHSLLANFSPSRWLLLFAVLIAVAVASPARAADTAAKVWQGKYESTLKKRWVTVRLTLATKDPSELRFVTEQCAVALQQASDGATAVYVVTTRQGMVAGPYCGIWLGGSLEAQLLDGGQRLKMNLTDRNGKSPLSLTLEPAP